MADYSIYKPTIKSNDYIARYDAHVYATQEIAQEVEDAREGENTLVDNLINNYAAYSLRDNIDGDCIYGTATGGDSVTLIDNINNQFTSEIVSSGETEYYIINITESTDNEISGAKIVGLLSESTIVTDSTTLPERWIAVVDWSGDNYIVYSYSKRCISMNNVDQDDTEYATKQFIKTLTDADEVVTITQLQTDYPENSTLINNAGVIEYRQDIISVVVDTSITPYDAVVNDVIAFTTNNESINLPSGTLGDVITFFDINKVVDLSEESPPNIIEIFPYSGERIMAQNVDVPLQITEFTYIFFKLIYVGNTTGWAMVDLQR